MKTKTNKTVRQGAALLVVLFVVMAITILSLGLLCQSDVELACGENMLLRTQMDFLAESGLEHAKGLIVSPQEVSSDYWRGNVGQQLAAGSDYYDVNVVRDDPNGGPTYRCNYDIMCEAYRNKDGEKVGRSTLKAQLRLDPCIALWTGADTTISSAVTVNGDVYCNGRLMNNGQFNGDVFADVLNGNNSCGQKKMVGDLSLSWPRVTVDDFTSNYSVQPIDISSLENTSLVGSSQVYYRNGNLMLAGGVRIEGMLIVNGDLVIGGSENVIIAEKNIPALLVTGDATIETGGTLEVYGLAVVNKAMQISGGTGGVSITGGLFIQDVLVETATDSSGNDNTCWLYNGPTWRPAGGQVGGALEFDGVDDTMEDPQASSYLNGLSAITISLWVKSDVRGKDRGILFTRNPTGSDEELGLRYDKSGAYGGGRRVIKASIRTTWGYTQIESTSNVQVTDWQHIAIVWESGSSLKLYINGELNALTYDKEGPVSGTISGVQKLMLGQGTKGRYWDGKIDDVRIYNRVLSEDEIYPPSGGSVGLLGYWALDETGGGDITITAAPSKTAVVVWSEAGAAENWGTAAGAFFKSIRRQ